MAIDVTKTIRDISELSPLAQVACGLFLDGCKKKGLNVLVTETYRPQERQNYLYAQGRTRAGNKVTWTKNSYHTTRMAWDVCLNIKGMEYSSYNLFIECGDVAKELGITWGGTWETKDVPHFQIDTTWKAPVLESPYDIALNKMVDKGIIGEKDKWALDKLSEVNVKYLMKSYIEKTMTQKDMAEYLQRKGIITTVSAWEDDKNIKKEYIDDLIINMANKL